MFIMAKSKPSEKDWTKPETHLNELKRIFEGSGISVKQTEVPPSGTQKEKSYEVKMVNDKKNVPTSIKVKAEITSTKQERHLIDLVLGKKKPKTAKDRKFLDELKNLKPGSQVDIPSNF